MGRRALEADRNAPVFAEGAVEVAADIDTVWDVVSDIARYPSWNPDIKDVTISGPVAAGTTFRWKSGPGTITSTIRRVESSRVLAWTGTTFTVKAVHVWRLEQADGRTTARLEESFNGFLARIFRGSLQKALRKAVESGLVYLKAEAERRAGR